MDFPVRYFNLASCLSQKSKLLPPFPYDIKGVIMTPFVAMTKQTYFHRKNQHATTTTFRKHLVLSVCTVYSIYCTVQQDTNVTWFLTPNQFRFLGIKVRQKESLNEKHISYEYNSVS